jgi:hypothetical protein
MLRTTLHRLGLPMLAAAAAALILTTTTALAGSGVGGVFNLGVVNTVDAQTTLTGNPAGNPLFKLIGSGTAATIRAEAGTGIAINGISVSGTGQFGQSTSGYGLFGTHTGATGANSGVWGQTNSTDASSAGVTGRNFGGGPGLQAIVTSNSVAPLKVNSSFKVTNLNADLLDGINSTRMWQLGGNAGTTPGTDFLGTSDNKALELKVNGQRVLRLEPGANVIGGDPSNFVVDGMGGATIAGGGSSGGLNNEVNNYFGTVGGGTRNKAGFKGTVAGGDQNTAVVEGAAVGGGVLNTAGNNSVVAGGYNNSASATNAAIGGGNTNTATAIGATVGGGFNSNATGSSSTIAGGLENNAAGQNDTIGGGYANSTGGGYGTVGGGRQNTASGAYATVPGGQDNVASGLYSFAAGYGATADDGGSFVWADQTGAISSPGSDTFSVRASGGIWLGKYDSTPVITPGHFIETSAGAGPMTPGAFLSSTGTWTNSSDRALKHHFRPLNSHSVLQKLATMPITSWSYKAEEPSIRHIGPMAQDFYSAFGLGLDNKHIGTIDEGGVALAAIQGLYKQNQALRHGNASLRARLTRLERTVAKLSR